MYKTAEIRWFPVFPAFPAFPVIRPGRPPGHLTGICDTLSFSISTSNFKPSTGWCLLSNRYWSNFHHTPTPVYAFKMLLVESTTHIHKQNEARLIGTPIFP